MKKVLFAFLPIIRLCACGGNNAINGEDQEVNPEEEVRNYGKYFIEKLNANQLDSLTVSYPDIEKADSVMPIKSDTIIVSETAPGQYDMTLAEGVVLKVNRADDGNIAVTESKGLFTFPADKIDIAKKTGMWDESLSDALLAERMGDNDFFNWVAKSKNINSKDILSLGKGVESTYERPGYATVVNKTDQPIKGSDYKVIYSVLEFEGMYPIESTKTKPGKDIPPHGSVKYDVMTFNMGGEEVKGVKLTLSQEQIKERFASYTGKEYQEYLDSNK